MEKEIDLKKIWGVIKRRLWIVIVLGVVLAALGGVYHERTYVPIYETSTRIMYNPNTEATVRQGLPDLETLIAMIKEPVVLKHVVEELNLPTSAEALTGKISVSQVGESKIVRIGVIDTDPERAAEIANTTAQIYQREMPNILNFDYVYILSEANVNTYPINESTNRLLFIGGVIGIVLGIGLVFLLDSLDDTIRTQREIESLHLTYLGSISSINEKTKGMKKEKRKLKTNVQEGVG